MSVANDTVSDRIDTAAGTLSPTQLALGLSAITLGLFLLAFSGEPLVHDAMHNGRHVAGVICH